MANNQYVNRVDFGNRTVMDISDTTASASDVMSGKKFYTASGTPTTGTLNVVDIVYPVGAIYMSTVHTSPATLFSGTTWDYISTSAKTVNELKAQPAQIISTASTVTQLKAQEAIIAGMIGVYAWKRTS